MAAFGYKLICTDGEAKNDEIPLMESEMPTVARFLRAHLNWSLASAMKEIDYTPEQPVFVEYFAAIAEMLDEQIFESKYQARSCWSLVESDFIVNEKAA